MASKTTKTLHSGYLSKVGAKVKNWKLRYMVLFGNGKLQYYKKPPVNIDTEEPQGIINVQADVVELILWDDVITKGLVKWPSAAIPQSGFAMRTRQGRVYQVHAESVEASDKWIAAVRSVGANIVMYEETIEALSRRSVAIDLNAGTPEDAAAAAADDSAEGDAATLKSAPAEDDEARYTMKVVGGMVVKTLNTPGCV